MKIHRLLVLIAFCFIIGNVHSQVRQVSYSNFVANAPSGLESALISKNFEFVAQAAYPIAGSPRNLIGSDFSISFSPAMIDSNLPFYGNINKNAVPGRDAGLKFSGKPQRFVVENHPDGYYISTKVITDTDTYSMALSVSRSGAARLTVISKNRETMSFQGEIR